MLFLKSSTACSYCELTRDRALIPHQIIKKRTIIVCCLFTFLLQMSMTSQTYILPFFFQAVKGTTARISGLDILPYGITITITVRSREPHHFRFLLKKKLANRLPKNVRR